VYNQNNGVAAGSTFHRASATDAAVFSSEAGQDDGMGCELCSLANSHQQQMQQQQDLEFEHAHKHQQQTPAWSTSPTASSVAAAAAVAAVAAAGTSQERAAPDPDWQYAAAWRSIVPDYSTTHRLGAGFFGTVFRVDAMVDRGRGTEQLQLATKVVTLPYQREQLAWDCGVRALLLQVSGMENVVAAQVLRSRKGKLEKLRLFMSYPGDSAMSIHDLLESMQLQQLRVLGSSGLSSLHSNLFYRMSVYPGAARGATPRPMSWPAVSMPFIGIYMLHYAMLRALNQVHTGTTPAIMRDVSCANMLLHDAKPLFQVVGPLMQQLAQQAAAMPSIMAGVSQAAAEAADLTGAKAGTSLDSSTTSSSGAVAGGAAPCSTASAAGLTPSTAAAAAGAGSSAAPPHAGAFPGWATPEFDIKLLEQLIVLQVSPLFAVACAAPGQPHLVQRQRRCMFMSCILVLIANGFPQVTFCDPESATRQVPGGQFLSAGFHIGGAEPYVVPDVVQLLWDGQLAQAAVAAAAGPWTDV
jgi:hypothetical protein